MDPVMEVAFYLEKEKIQQRIEARRQAMQQRMNVENEAAAKAQATNANPEPISLVSDDDDESSCDSAATMEYPDVPVAAISPAVQRVYGYAQPVQRENNNPVQMGPRNPVVPMTLQELWQRVDRVPRGGLDPPACSNTACPYCTTPQRVPLMLQRYYLMGNWKDYFMEFSSLVFDHNMHELQCTEHTAYFICPHHARAYNTCTLQAHAYNLVILLCIHVHTSTS